MQVNSNASMIVDALSTLVRFLYLIPMIGANTPDDATGEECITSTLILEVRVKSLDDL